MNKLWLGLILGAAIGVAVNNIILGSGIGLLIGIFITVKSGDVPTRSRDSSDGQNLNLDQNQMTSTLVGFSWDLNGGGSDSCGCDGGGCDGSGSN